MSAKTSAIIFKPLTSQVNNTVVTVAPDNVMGYIDISSEQSVLEADVFQAGKLGER